MQGQHRGGEGIATLAVALMEGRIVGVAGKNPVAGRLQCLVLVGRNRHMDDVRAVSLDADPCAVPVERGHRCGAGDGSRRGA